MIRIFGCEFSTSPQAAKRGNLHLDCLSYNLRETDEKNPKTAFRVGLEIALGTSDERFIGATQLHELPFEPNGDRLTTESILAKLGIEKFSNKYDRLENEVMQFGQAYEMLSSIVAGYVEGCYMLNSLFNSLRANVVLSNNVRIQEKKINIDGTQRKQTDWLNSELCKNAKDVNDIKTLINAIKAQSEALAVTLEAYFFNEQRSAMAQEILKSSHKNPDAFPNMYTTEIEIPNPYLEKLN